MVCYLIKWALIVTVTAPFYLLFRRPQRRGDGGRPGREAALGAFVLFMISLFVLVFQGTYQPPGLMLQTAAERIRRGEGVNLIPFRTIGSFLGQTKDMDGILVNIIGNIVMFVPWGLGLPLLWKKNQRVGRVLLFCALLPLGIEATQLFIGRSVDVDDWILNFLGGCLGGLLYVVLRRGWPETEGLSV